MGLLARRQKGYNACAVHPARAPQPPRAAMEVEGPSVKVVGMATMMVVEERAVERMEAAEAR